MAVTFWRIPTPLVALSDGGSHMHMTPPGRHRADHREKDHRAYCRVSKATLDRSLARTITFDHIPMFAGSRRPRRSRMSASLRCFQICAKRLNDIEYQYGSCVLSLKHSVGQREQLVWNSRPSTAVGLASGLSGAGSSAPADASLTQFRSNHSNIRELIFR